MPEDSTGEPRHDPQPPQAPGPAPTDKDALQLEQLRLTNTKLGLEAQKLARDGAPEKWWTSLARNIVAIGGVLTVAATAYGLYDSYNKTLTARISAQVTEQRTQFEDAIKKLESSSTVSKLVAVSILSGYLGEKDRSFHRQILFTFAGVAATEGDPQTQAAILDLMTAQRIDVITVDDWSYFQDMLVSQSRALVAKGNLYEHRQFGIAAVAPEKDEVAARHVGSLIALLVRKGVVPKYTTYRGIYCEACSFRDARFPSGTDFTMAVLDRADFRGAVLKGAAFDNAELDGAVFAGAYLKGAKFRTLTSNHVADGRSSTFSEAMEAWLQTPRLQHMEALLQSRAQVTITMPDFSCANLQGALFNNLALFFIPGHVERTFAAGDEALGGWRASVEKPMQPQFARESVRFSPVKPAPPSFYRADLRDASLDDIRFYSLWDASKDLHSTNFRSAIATGNRDLEFGEGAPDKKLLTLPQLEADGTPVSISSTDVFEGDRSIVQSDIRFAFMEANLAGAKLPEGFASVLTIKFPFEFNRKLGFHDKYRLRGEIDWDCATRTAP